MAETNIFGVFFGGGLTAACLATILLVILRRILARVGFYAFVWNRPLVDLAFFTLLWALASAIVPQLSAAFGGTL
jgi:hypothetical protein